MVQELPTVVLISDLGNQRGGEEDMYSLCEVSSCGSIPVHCPHRREGGPPGLLPVAPSPVDATEAKKLGDVG